MSGDLSKVRKFCRFWRHQWEVVAGTPSGSAILSRCIVCGMEKVREW